MNANPTITSETLGRIPKVIWMYWHQGFDHAPKVVRHCVHSWKKQNPDWQVILLDKDTIETYIEPLLKPHVRERIGLAHQSDVLRLQLLATYGGIWADATSLCRKPLNNWLPANIPSGFFAFYKPGPDRLISNWFLVSEKQGTVAVKLQHQLADFYNKYQFDKPGFIRRKLVKLIGKVLNRSTETTHRWFSPLFTNVLRIYPYFVFHYLFARLVQTDSPCRAIWEATPKVSTIPPHKIRRHGMLSPLTDTIKSEIDNDDCPIYKLSWKYEPTAEQHDTIVAYLLAKYPIDENETR